MNYMHPKEYKGVRFNSEYKQIRTRAIVEEYCLKCDLFMGKDHDFSECRLTDLWSKGEIVKKKTCPFNSLAIPIDIVDLQENWIKYKVEE